MTDTASPCPEESPKLEAMPGRVRDALAEVSAAVEMLNRDQAAAIAEQAFERGADLRKRAEALLQRKSEILREWQQSQHAKHADPDSGGLVTKS